MGGGVSIGSMLPSDRGSTPEEDLQSAINTRLGITPQVLPTSSDAPIPLGRTWAFDWEHGRFFRVGSSPIETRGIGSLIEWCQMAIHSARYAHDCFSDDFGMEGIDEPIGSFAVGEVVADWTRHLTEALLVHDRIAAVQNVKLDWDPSSAILTVESLEIVTDESEIVSLGDVQVQGQSL